MPRHFQAKICWKTMHSPSIYVERGDPLLVASCVGTSPSFSTFLRTYFDSHPSFYPAASNIYLETLHYFPLAIGLCVRLRVRVFRD